MPDATGVRLCTRTGCAQVAVATLSYAYAQSTATVGPLASSVEPHAYDLCQRHAAALTAPRGWRLVRLDGIDEADDLLAVANAVWEPPARESPGRGHLRLVPPGA